MRPAGIAHSVTRGAFYLTLEKASALLSGIAYFALLLRWMGPTKYGILTLALSFAGLATMATGNFEMFLERYAAEYFHHGRLRTLRRVMFTVLGLKSALGALAGLALWFVAPVLAKQFDTPELAVLLPVLTLTVAMDGFYTTGRATLFGVQKFKFVSLLAVAFHVSKTAMVGAMWGIGLGIDSLVVGLTVLTIAQGFAQFVIPVWMLRRARDDGPEALPASESRSLPKQIAAYCLPLLGARITFTSGANLGKIVLGKLFTTTQLGHFSFAYQTVERFVELVYALPTSLLPSFTRLVAEGDKVRLAEIAGRAHRLIQVVAALLSFFLFAFAREITVFVGSPMFEPAVPLLRVLALVPIARTAHQPLTMLFQALKRPGIVFRLAAIKFVTEFGCYFALVPLLGLAGAAVSNLAGAVVAYGAALAGLAREMPAGADERRSSVLRSALLFVPLFVLAWLASERLQEPASIVVRGLLAMLSVWLVFAAGLVDHEDIGRVAEIPLESRWMRRVRDLVVNGAFAVARDRAGGRA